MGGIDWKKFSPGSAPAASLLAYHSDFSQGPASERKVIILQGKSRVNSGSEEPHYYPEKGGFFYTGFAVRSSFSPVVTIIVRERAPSYSPAPPQLPFAPEGKLQKRHFIQFVRTMEFVRGNLTDGHREDEDMPGKAEEKSFGKPDEVRGFPTGKVGWVTIGGATIGRATLG